MTKREFLGPPTSWSSFDDGIRKTGQVIRNITLRGKTNNTFEITLTPNVTTSTISNALITPDSEVFLIAKSATAATAVGAGVIWVSIAAGVATINHDSNAATDRDFGAVVIG